MWRSIAIIRSVIKFRLFIFVLSIVKTNKIEIILVAKQI